MRLAAYLIMTLLFSTATAQNPTILQGNYISNVFGQSNFVKNPNAQTSVTGVTLTAATATRSRTTPLVATTEWNVTITSANGTVAWETRAFDAGMKNQNCEARFTYRGFQATSKAQIKQGANVVAELALTPSATDPRIASINFPCGDLSSATTFVITDTAILSGTHEIGGIYVGLATNQANIAQAEVVVRAMMSANQGIPYNIMTPLIFDGELVDKYNAYDPVNGQFTFPSAGCYKLEAVTRTASATLTAGNRHFSVVYLNGLLSSRVGGDDQNVNASITQRVTLQAIGTYCGAAGESMQAAYYTDRTSGQIIDALADVTRLTIYRFPSSSELVVTPETQNVWGGVSIGGSSVSVGLLSGSAASLNYVTATSASVPSRRTLYGLCEAPTTSTNDIGCSVPNMPVGNYEITFSGFVFSVPGNANAQTNCASEIRETTLDQQVSVITNGTTTNSAGQRDYYPRSSTGVFNNTSVATRNFIFKIAKSVDNSTSNLGSCNFQFGNTGSGTPVIVSMVIKPLDNNANSALYVQGPVKAAATGTAIPAGYVGEKLNFTSRTIGAVTTGYTANSGGKLATLTPGVWLIFAQVSGGGGIGLTGYGAFISTGTNNANDQWITGTPANTTYVNDVNFGSATQMIVVTYNATTATDIYAKAVTYGANNLLTIRGYAIRLN